MEPFDSYPKGGKELLGRFGRGFTIRGNTRMIRGPDFMRKTGQTACAYCGLSLVASFENWLQMQLDHVVPRKVCQEWGMCLEWRDDLTNIVLACTACNGFDNQYLPASVWTE